MGYFNAGCTEEEMMEAIGVVSSLSGSYAIYLSVTVWLDALENFTGTLHYKKTAT